MTINVRGGRPGTPDGIPDGAPDRLPVAEPVAADAPDGHGEAGLARRTYPDDDLSASAATVAVAEGSSDEESASSASLHSPPLEVAEVEDIDQNYTGAGWGSLVSVSVEPEGREYLVSRFPFYSRECDAREPVLQMVKTVELGERRPTRAPFWRLSVREVLTCLAAGSISCSAIRDFADWLGYCVERGEQQALDWYEIFAENRDFWEEIPSVLEAILRRRYVSRGQTPVLAF